MNWHWEHADDENSVADDQRDKSIPFKIEAMTSIQQIVSQCRAQQQILEFIRYLYTFILLRNVAPYLIESLSSSPH